MSEALRSVSDHWWWRPGWSEGRRFYTWHFTFEGQTALHEMAREYQKTISRFPFYDLVPLEWLHLTTQGIGFADRVSEAQALAIVAKVEERLASRKALTVAVGAPLLFSEAIACPIAPAEPLVQVRDAIRGAIEDVMGSVDEGTDFHPHVSFAYSNASSPAKPVRIALEAIRPRPVEAGIRYVDLIRLGRDRRIYEWELVRRVAFED